MRQAGSAVRPARGHHAAGKGGRAVARPARDVARCGPSSPAVPAVPGRTPRRRRRGRTLGPTAASPRWPAASGVPRPGARRGGEWPVAPRIGRPPRRGGPRVAPRQRRLPMHPQSATRIDSAGAAGRGPGGLAVKGRGGEVAEGVAGGGRKRWGRPHAPAPGRNQRSKSAGSRATLYFAWEVESAHRDH